MRALAPLRYDASSPLGRAHPLARLAAAAILILALFLSLDSAAAALALVAIAAAVPLLGLRPVDVARRAVPLAVAAGATGLFNGLVAGDAGAGLTVALRLTGVGLAGVVALATIEPTELADALVEHLHASPRFAVGALAALRLLPVFVREWEVRGLARRARGVEADRTAPGRLAAFPERTFGLLAGAIRRATALALAMDARGFGARPCRTLARPRAFGPRDGVLLGSVVAVALAVVLVATRAAR